MVKKVKETGDKTGRLGPDSNSMAKPTRNRDLCKKTLNSRELEWVFFIQNTKLML
jgi:hypothetical protein